MTQDEARKVWRDTGLSFKDLSINDFMLLRNFIDDELAEYRRDGGGHAVVMDMRIGNLKKKDYHITATKGLKFGFITVRSSYFPSREAISFNPDGFIGFAGWASSCNTDPFLKAFVLWCGTLLDNPK